MRRRWFASVVLAFALGAFPACQTMTPQQAQKARDCSVICQERLGSRAAARRVDCVLETWMYDDGERTIETCRCRCYSVEVGR